MPIFIMFMGCHICEDSHTIHQGVPHFWGLTHMSGQCVPHLWGLAHKSSRCASFMRTHTHTDPCQVMSRLNTHMECAKCTHHMSLHFRGLLQNFTKLLKLMTLIICEDFLVRTWVQVLTSPKSPHRFGVQSSLSPHMYSCAHTHTHTHTHTSVLWDNVGPCKPGCPASQPCLWISGSRLSLAKLNSMAHHMCHFSPFTAKY